MVLVTLPAPSEVEFVMVTQVIFGDFYLSIRCGESSGSDDVIDKVSESPS